MKKVMVFIFGLVILLCTTPIAFAAKGDATGPNVASIYTTNSQGNVMADSDIYVRFNEKIQKGNKISQINIRDDRNAHLGFTYEITDNMIKLKSKYNMRYSTAYRLIIPAGAIKDMSGNELEEAYVYHFVTESKADAVGIVEEEEEIGKSTDTIHIDTVIKDTLTEEDKAFLTAALRAIGVTVNNISVKAFEEAEPEEAEETTEESEDAVEVEADSEDEATSFDLYLVDSGPRKIQVIKIVRELTSLGLKEAKDLVDGCANEPKIVKENISWDEADSCGRKIEEQGATILIIGHGEDVYD